MRAAFPQLELRARLGVMIAALADPHPWVRTNALVAIARVGAKDPRALMKPEEALRVTIMTEDPDPGTRASSIDALGYYAKQNEPARKRLMEIAGNGSRQGDPTAHPG